MDETTKDHEVTSSEDPAKTGESSSANPSPVAPASKAAPTQAKAASDDKSEKDPKAELRTVARERIRAELSTLSDNALLRLFSDLSELTDITLEKMTEIVLKLPQIDPDNGKDQAKREAIIALFKKEMAALGEVPLKEFKKVTTELAFERISKNKPRVGDEDKNRNQGGDAEAKAKAQAEAKRLLDQELAKIKDANDKNAALAKDPNAKALEDLAKAEQAARAAQSDKGIGEALKNALAGQNQDQGQGQGQGQGGGESGSGSGGGGDSGGGKDSGAGDSGKSLSDSSKNKDKPSRNNSSSSTNSPSLADNAKSAAPEKKENKFQFPESSKEKEEPKKTATPAASDIVQSDTGIDPKVSQAGSFPAAAAPQARSLGQGQVGSVIPAAQQVQDAGAVAGGDSGGAQIASGSQAPSSSGGGGDFFQKTPSGTAYATAPPTTTGYNMIKTGPNDWQASDGGSGSEGGYGQDVADDDGSYKRRGAMQAGAGLVGLPNNTAPTFSGGGDSVARSFAQPQGVFLVKKEWSGGGLCQGLNHSVIGVCQRSSRQPASTGPNRI